MIARVLTLILLFVALGWGLPWWGVIIALLTNWQA